MTTKGNISVFMGRFNPFTVYHKDIIEQMEGNKIIVTTSSYDDKNPIGLDLKLELMSNTLNEFYPDVTLLHARDAFTALKTVRSTCPHLGDWGSSDSLLHVTLHCGSDRAGEYLRLNTYTHETGVVIEKFVVHHRINDAQSATRARIFARLGDWKHFREICGYNGSDAERAYESIQKYYAGLQG